VGAGSYGLGRSPVTSNLKDCCTSDRQCAYGSEENIPGQCKVVATKAGKRGRDAQSNDDGSYQQPFSN